MKINAYMSPDGRIRTENYDACGETNFSVAETTAIGTLITTFRTNGEVVGQVYMKKAGADALEDYLSDFGGARVAETDKYEHVKVNAACRKCGGVIERELDLREPKKIATVPVAPMFVCRGCGSRFYSVTDAYLRNLIKGNTELFSSEELAEKGGDERTFVDTLQKYIIRIFASKKISRLEIKG